MIKNPLSIKFKLTHSDAILPKAAKEGDIGFDLYAVEDFYLFPQTTGVIKTGLTLAGFSDAPHASWFMKVEGRSGLASKGIFPVGGIIDPSYRGEIGVILFNSNPNPTNPNCVPTPYKITKGDRIAQLVLYSVISGGEVLFKQTEEIEETQRGDSGFGSSGK